MVAPFPDSLKLLSFKNKDQQKISKKFSKTKKTGWKKLDENYSKIDTPKSKEEILQQTLFENPKLFVLDSLGDRSSLNTYKYEKNLKQSKYPFSKFGRIAIEKTQKNSIKRAETLSKFNQKRELETAFADPWEKPHLEKKPLYVCPRPNHVPNVIAALPGQSVNPSLQSLKKVVISAAETELRKTKLQEISHSRLYPITTTLNSIIPKLYMDQLDDFQKQKIFSLYHRLLAANTTIDKISKSLSSQIIKLLKNPQENSTDIQETHIIDDTERQLRKTIKKKTTSHRKRIKQHKKKLYEAVNKKKFKRFQHSFSSIKTIIRELENNKKAEDEGVQRFENRKKAQLNAELSGRILDKHSYFKDLKIDVILPSDVLKTQGSIRKLPLSQVAGSAVRDRIESIYKRKLLTPPTLPTPSALARLQNQMHRKKKSRQTILRYK